MNTHIIPNTSLYKNHNCVVLFLQGDTTVMIFLKNLKICTIKGKPSNKNFPEPFGQLDNYT